MKDEVIQIPDDRCSKCVQMNGDISEVLIFKLLSLFHAQIYYDYYYYYYYYPCYHLYTRYLQLCTWNKPYFYGIQCCSCSVFTVCATCNVISPVQYVLHFYISTSRSLCAVPKKAVFCSSLISCFPDMLLRYSLSEFEMDPVAHIITGITLAFTFHMWWISVMRSLYF